ncbi:response regulator [Salinimonas chungwhensis]|uniref:response regulator n=1 Tax=Salinimonas chungwhensis TaxID=265425 RepID=UPI000374FF44|nr:response regulator [Salinimonas chungwhensis]
MARQSVVVIDDDAITLQRICDALVSQLKMNVYAVNYSKLARDCLRQQHDATVSLIISDQMMSDYDGLHLLT